METNKCPEFPFFGATYPDATCIDGKLFDLDSYEEDGSTSYTEKDFKQKKIQKF